MSSNRQTPMVVNTAADEAEVPFSLPLEVVNNITSFLTAEEKLSCSMNSLFAARYRPSALEKVKQKRLLKELCQVVIDDKRDEVVRLLNKHPELLLMPIQEKTVIESQYTWQRFDVSGETILSIAAKRKQIEMIKVFKPHQDQLIALSDENRLLITHALSNWSHYQFDAEGNIVIPQKYQDMVDGLIHQFRQENLPNNHRVNQPISQAGESALQAFREIVLPKESVKLGEGLEDGYWDVELLLYAAYKCYVDLFNQFQRWNQRDVYCVKVIGAIQSLLSPETAKIFCQGLWDVVENGASIQARAAALKLLSYLDGQEKQIDFYRTSRDFSGGLGVDYIAGSWCLSLDSHGVPSAEVRWKTYVEQKQRIYENYAANYREVKTPQPQ